MKVLIARNAYRTLRTCYLLYRAGQQPAPEYIGAVNENQIAHFVSKSLTAKSGSESVLAFDVIADAEALRLQTSTGLAVRGFTCIMDDGAVRHTFKNNGNPATEVPRGQIAVTPEDFTLIPLIVKSYDKVKPGGKNAIGRDTIVYEKRIGDIYFYVEEIRTGRKRLARQTLYKRKAPK